MKEFNALILSLGLILVIGNELQAQVVLPDVSPYAMVSQRIGFDDVRIEYARPSVRGRIIFGDLVPYGDVWSIGSDASARMYVYEELTISDEHKLAPGVYTIYAIPGKEEWTLIFNRVPRLWGYFGYYRQAYDVLRLTIKPEPLKEQVETLTIQFANVCATCAELQLLWDFTRVSCRISTQIDDWAMSEIKTSTLHPEARIAGEYYLSAKYYLDTDRDLKQAMEWIDKALYYLPTAYWMIHTKAEIYAKMGNYREAISTAELSMKEAKARNDADYVRINEKEIEKWKELNKNRKGL